MVSGETIRLIRNWRKLAQKQAASLLGISQPAYSKLEKKKEINGRLLEKIKKAFLCTDDDLQRFTPPENK